MKSWLALFLIATIQIALPSAALASAFAGNTLRDTFEVKEIANGQAICEGDPKGLKAGSTLYFPRSPFQFQVTEVKGNRVTVSLPDKHDLAVGQNLLRNLSESIKKAMDTEHRLKEALEE